MGRFSMTIWSQNLKNPSQKNPGFFLKKSGHQYRFKISLRIECYHSQPLKITLKHSNLHPKEKHFWFNDTTLFKTLQWLWLQTRNPL